MTYCAQNVWLGFGSLLAFLTPVLTMKRTPAMNSADDLSFCLSFPSAGVVGTHCHTQALFSGFDNSKGLQGLHDTPQTFAVVIVHIWDVMQSPASPRICLGNRGHTLVVHTGTIKPRFSS